MYLNFREKYTSNALISIAKLAVERKTGARGLRAILEGVMLDIMFEIPSNPDIKKVIINEETIKNQGNPELIFKSGNKKMA